MFIIFLSLLDFEKQPKPVKHVKRGRKCSIPAEKLHSQFNKYSSQIVKDGAIVMPSKTQIYKKIAKQFQDYKAQAIYLAAKRFFDQKISNVKLSEKTVCEDYFSSFDRYNLKPKQYNKFSVDIQGIPFFRNEKGGTKSTSEWATAFRKIVFAMNRAPCAWSISRPRMAGNEITINAHCLENECDAKLFAFTENNHAILTIHVMAPNSSIKHEKKTKFEGQKEMKFWTC